MATSVDFTTEVQKLYVAYFSRPGDPTGVAFWVDKLQNNLVAYQDISAEFSTSAEYQAMYGGKNNAAVVAEVYDNLFGRQPVGGEDAFWINALNTGATDVDNVVTAIAAGAQGSDEFAYNGKVAIAVKFTQHIDTDAEKAAYSGAAANQVAIDYLAGAKDITSIAMRMDAGNIDSTIARIVGTPSSMDVDHIAMM